ncbi:MAG: hypothetical protein ABJC12_11045, partial [Saprospiraceae bacterium]
MIKQGKWDGINYWLRAIGQVFGFRVLGESAYAVSGLESLVFVFCFSKLSKLIYPFYQSIPAGSASSWVPCAPCRNQYETCAH